jgi:hypothetical protein
MPSPEIYYLRYDASKTSCNIKTYVEVRDREYLFKEEVEAIVKAAFKNRFGRPGSHFRNFGKRS